MESLAEERSQTNFNVRQMTFFIDGGEEKTKLKEKIMLEIERDPTFRQYDINNLTLQELRERLLTRARSVTHYLSVEPVEDFRVRYGIIGLVDPGFMTRIGVHWGLFVNALLNSSTPEQLQYWIPKGPLTLKKFFGCFAMTELGHGSNVAGLETTATFDPNSDEFIIHSPTITSTKWWIGGAAQTATHAIVFAQLIVKGKSYGVKSFMVPLRDPETFTVNSGVTIGDCGAKMGRHGIDNGWIQFTHVRIPRSNMLMRYTKVSREGEVTEPPMNQLAYGALINGRVHMVKESADLAKKAMIIAVRYALVRRQFSTTHGAPENKIMDYGTHQQRLFPLLAATYAINFTALEVARIYDELMAKMERLKPTDPSIGVVIESLKETHATSAGLKAYCTWYTLNLIEQCRQTLGGNGYSAYAGLSSMYQDFAVQCTWEGDNTVLMLQVGRYLISSFKNAKKGRKLPMGVNYLNNLANNLKTQHSSNQITLDVVSEAFDVIRSHLVANIGEEFEKCLQKGLGEDAAYEECSAIRFNAAKVHCMGYMYQRFCDALKRAPESLRKVLSDLCLVHGLQLIQENSGIFLQFGYFKPENLKMIQKQMHELFQRIRTQAAGLVDAFNFSDFMVNSPFGRYDGDIYVQYFEQVKRANPYGPHPYFEKTLKPFFFRRDDFTDEHLALEGDE